MFFRKKKQAPQKIECNGYTIELQVPNKSSGVKKNEVAAKVVPEPELKPESMFSDDTFLEEDSDLSEQQPRAGLPAPTGQRTSVVALRAS